LFTADQLVAHAVGDYVLQSDWMAQRKTKESVAAAAHAITYSLPFLLFKPSLIAFLVILVTHFMIDRFRIARFVTWAKNGPWHPKTATGYPESAPPWLAVWLLIIADNVLHVLVNGAALRWL
jgi:hypothetical protein